jgi:hypothetical protein
LRHAGLELLEIAADDTILEIGFGSGVTIECLAGLVPAGQVSGIDQSLEVVRRRGCTTAPRSPRAGSTFSTRRPNAALLPRQLRRCAVDQFGAGRGRPGFGPRRDQAGPARRRHPRARLRISFGQTRRGAAALLGAAG